MSQVLKIQITAIFFLLTLFITPHLALAVPSEVTVSVIDTTQLKVAWRINKRQLAQGKLKVKVSRQLSSGELRNIRTIAATQRGTILFSLKASDTVGYRASLIKGGKTIASTFLLLSDYRSDEERTRTALGALQHSSVEQLAPSLEIQIDRQVPGAVVESSTPGADTNPGPTHTPTPMPSPMKINSSSCDPVLQNEAYILINIHRVQQGLAALVPNVYLEGAATLQSEQMAQSGVLTHDGWLGNSVAAGFQHIYLSQNVGYTQTWSNEIVPAWLTSPPHKANIESSVAQYMGVSCVRGTEGQYWWTAYFGK